ncbi:MAG: FAD-dependent oxidoreductase [Gaiellaceae bacterium]
MSRGSAAVVGGGILGLTAAYRLSQAGVRVSVFERARDLGGLVGTFDFDGTPADRFYHVVLPTDDRVIGLASELGLGDTFRFRPTKVGVYGDGRLVSMTSPREFLTFPLLSFSDRIRLAQFLARCQLKKTHADLDDTPLLDWLRRMCGRRVVERLWEPLLDSKFDGRYADLPATYIWSRSRRMSTTRDRGGREVMGWPEGGYQRLIDELARRIVALGGEIHTETSVDRIVAAADRAAGIVVNGDFRAFDVVLCTLTPAQARRLYSPELAVRMPADHGRYLGVICLLLRVTRSVSPYYHLNITDRSVPLTTIVETTHVVDPDAVGGHLLYISKYVDPTHPAHDLPAHEVAVEYLRHARTIFPDLRDQDIISSRVQRARITEPVHVLGGAKNVPDMFPMPGIALASTAHVYPEIVSGQAMCGVAERVVDGILERMPGEQRAAA